MNEIVSGRYRAIYRVGMRRRYDPSVDRWVPLPVADVRDLIADGRAWLSGGVALDVLLGYESRAHGDVDVSVTAEDFPDLVATLPDWLHCFAARSGLLAPLDETLDHEPLVRGMRVVSPEVQLLWKSAAPLAKDDADRTAVAPLLDDEARDWLDAAIRTAHPESPWRNAFR